MRNMPNYEIIDKMENILNIASDSTRIKILYSLLNDEACHEQGCHGECEVCSDRIERTVTEIVKATGASQSLVSHQLKVLKDARLVASRKEGKQVYYSIIDGHVKLLLEVVYEHVMEEEDEKEI